MTAHPKVDPLRNRMVGWTWRAGADLVRGKPSVSPLDTRPLLHVNEWDENFQPAPAVSPEEEEIEGEEIITWSNPTSHLPLVKEGTHLLLSNTAVAPHDFSFTRRHYLFVENRLQGNTLPYILGKKCPAECVDLQPRQDMLLHLLRRPAAAVTSASTSTPKKGDREGQRAGDVLTVPLSPGFTIHSVNAWEHTPSSSSSPSPSSDSENEEEEDKGDVCVSLLTTAWEGAYVRSGKVKGGLLGAWEGRAPLFDDIPPTLLYRSIVRLSNSNSNRGKNENDGKGKIGKMEAELVSHGPVDGMENIIVEHPHINPAYEGREVRWVFMSVGSQTGVSSPPLG